jgi:hypothetical protein
VRVRCRPRDRLRVRGGAFRGRSVGLSRVSVRRVGVAARRRPSETYKLDPRDLLAAELPAPKYAVEGLFPEGLTFMAGAPKLGKSWLGLGLRIAVASGGHALGKIAVTQGDVLYLALEDNARRLRRSASAPARRRLRS